MHILSQDMANFAPHICGKILLLNKLEILTVTDLAEIFKSGPLSRKMSISERLGSAMQLRKRNESKRKKIKTFAHKINSTVLIFS